MSYSIEKVATLIGAHRYGHFDAQVEWLLTDSRSLAFPETTLFFALRTRTGDGHRYIDDLYRRGVTSLLVEGGPSLHRAFLDSGIWDEARVERSDAIFGHGVESAPMPQGRMKVQRIENRLIFNIIR